MNIRQSFKVAFAVENFDEWLPDAMPLLQWACKERGLAELKINKPLYRQKDKDGSLVIITARSEGKLIGHIVFAVSNHPHYSIKVASQDCFHVDREHLQTRIAFDLFRTAMEYLKDSGVKIVSMTSPAGASHGKLYEALGFKQIETVYAMELK